MLLTNSSFCLLLLVAHYASAWGQRETKPFLNIWAVKVHGGLENARQIAKQNGYHLVEQVTFYLFSFTTI